jgi:hypothetical protein
MRDFIYLHLQHVLCVLVLISRLGDVVSTRLATRTLKLEANPIARRLGWWFIVATLGLCLVPYFSVGAGVMIFVMSSFVAASNTGKLWAIRALGEEEYRRHLCRVVRKTRPLYALSAIAVSAAFILLVGVTQILLGAGPAEDWGGYWFGMGIVGLALALFIHGSLGYLRMYREAGQHPADRVDAPPAQGPP